MATAQPRNANSQPDLPTIQPQPRKKGRFGKGLLFVCLFVVGGGIAAGTLTQRGKDIVQVTREWAIPAIEAKQDPNLLFNSVGTPDRRVNVLLVGRDRNWKQGKVFDPTIGKFRRYQVEDTDTRPRSDTMIIASFDETARTVRMISIPRDTRVRFRDFNGNRHSATKLNSVYALPDGDKLLVKVINDELGVRIDRVAEIKLDGFTKLIDRVDGVDINVEGALFSGKRTRMKYTDNYGGWKVDLDPGMQHLDGEQAHGYVRYRMDNEGDPGRVRRQQQVMRALSKKMMNVGLLQLPGLVTELQNLFNTDLKNEELVSAALFAKSLGDAAKISPLTPYGTYEENGDIKLNRPQNEKLFAAIFGPSFNAKNFLKLSPETTRDDIGARNNDNPAALSVLREAGLLDETKRRSGELKAPGLQ